MRLFVNIAKELKSMQNRIIIAPFMFLLLLFHFNSSAEQKSIEEQIEENYSLLGISFDSAIVASKRLLRLEMTIDQRADINRTIGIGFNCLAKTDSSEKYLVRGEQCLEGEDVRNAVLIKIRVQLGSLYNFSDRHEEAKKYFSLALKGASQNNDKYMVAYIKKELSKMYFYLKDTKSSIKLARESLAYFEKTEDQQGSTVELLNSLGNAYLEDSVELSYFYLNEALTKYGDNISTSQIILLRNNLANCKLKLGQNREAIEEYRELKGLCTGDQSLAYLLGPIEINIGAGYLNLKQYDSALIYVKRGKRLVKKSKSKTFVYEAIVNLIEIYDSIGDSVNLNRNRLKLEKLKYEMQSDVYSAELEGVQKDHDLLMKEFRNAELKNENAEQDEIIMTKNRVLLCVVSFVLVLLISLLLLIRLARRLKDKNKIIERKNQDLARSTTKKDQMLAIIGHDLRAPIAQLLAIQKEYQEDNLTNEQRVSMGKKIMHSTQKGLLLIDDLLQWTNSFLHDSYERKKFSIQKVLNEVKDEQLERLEHKEIIIEESVERLEIKNDEQTVKIILRNVLSNAIKFSPVGGKLRINASQSSKEVIILIKDEGVGMSKEKMDCINDVTCQKKVNSSLGTDNEKGTGIGLSLSKDFARKINAKIQIMSSTSEGTEVMLSIKK